MSDFGPSHIINIKKEKRETDEETKQILRMLQKDDVSGHGRGVALVALGCCWVSLVPLSVLCATGAMLNVPCATGAVLNVPYANEVVLNVPCVPLGWH